MRLRLTYANVTATAALFVVMGGSAFAAITISGANVANNSLTGTDVKGASLSVADLSLAAKASLKGAKGATGRPGSVGANGTTGADGAQGPRGSEAFMTSAFAYRDTGLVTQRTGTSVPNNNGGTGKDWDSATYASSAFGGPFPQIRATNQPTPAAPYQQINLTGTYQPIVSLTGMTGTDSALSPNSLLTVTFSEAFLNATASLTFLHRADGESLDTHTGGTLLHGRIECALFYGSNVDPSTLSLLAGVPAQASSGSGGKNHELVNISMNGNAGTPEAYLTPGVSYNVTVKCRDADFTGNTQWQLARGNLTALASR